MKLREYINERWASHRREHKLELHAVMTAAIDIDRRLEAMNELRGQIDKERGTFVTTTTYDAKHEALATRIAAVETAQAAFAGRLSVYAAGAGLIGSAAITFLTHLVKF